MCAPVIVPSTLCVKITQHSCPLRFRLNIATPVASGSAGGTSLWPFMNAMNEVERGRCGAAWAGVAVANTAAKASASTVMRRFMTRLSSRNLLPYRGEGGAQTCEASALTPAINGTASTIGAEKSTTHWPGWSYALGTVTRTDTVRYTVDHVWPLDCSSANQHTPDRPSSWASCGTWGWAPPQVSTIGGSPYAAACSAPAETGRRVRSRRLAGSLAIKARHTVAAGSSSAGGLTETGPNAWVAGVEADDPGAAGKPPNSQNMSTPVSSAAGTATKVATRPGERTITGERRNRSAYG